MIKVTPHMRVLLAVEPVDSRAGIDGLAAVCRKRLAADPFSGAMFIFGNRRRTAIRVLVYDGQGFWLAFAPSLRQSLLRRTCMSARAHCRSPDQPHRRFAALKAPSSKSSPTAPTTASRPTMPSSRATRTSR